MIAAAITLELVLALIGLACAAFVLAVDIAVEFGVRGARAVWGTLPYHAIRYLGAGTLVALALDVLTR